MGIIAASAAAISVASAILGIAYPAFVAEKGSVVSKKIRDLAQLLANKLSKNQALMDKAQIAYSTKSASLATEVLKGCGVGNRAQALALEANRVEGAYKQEANKLIDENKKIQQQQNELDKANAIAGQSIAGNNMAEDIVQNIKGGIE